MIYMVQAVEVYAFLAKSGVLILGLIILYYTTRAAYFSGDGGLWILSIGILFSGIGLVFTGTLSAVFGVDPLLDMALTSTVAAVGLLVVLFSMFTADRDHITR